jgi:hypothetical protein
MLLAPRRTSLERIPCPARLARSAVNPSSDSPTAQVKNWRPSVRLAGRFFRVLLVSGFRDRPAVISHFRPSPAGKNKTGRSSPQMEPGCTQIGKPRTGMCDAAYPRGLRELRSPASPFPSSPPYRSLAVVEIGQTKIRSKPRIIRITLIRETASICWFGFISVIRVIRG